MAKTSRDARRHIKEIGKLFTDVSEVGEEIIRNFLDRYREKRYLRQSVKRLIQRGFLKQKSDRWILTVAGKRYFRKVSPKTPMQQNTAWDGKWRLISFDVPTNRNTQRDLLRGLLREFDFYPLQKSVWISPNFVDDDFWKLLIENNLNTYCKVMLVEILEGENELKRYFHLMGRDARTNNQKRNEQEKREYSISTHMRGN